MSEPKSIEAYGALELVKLLTQRLDQEQVNFRTSLPKALAAAETARDRRRSRFDGYLRYHDEVAAEGQASIIPPVEEFRLRQEGGMPPAQMPAMPKDPAMEALRQLADIGLRDFNAQLYIVQADD